MQTYTVNTGALRRRYERNYRAVIYSPKVYLIKFKGDIQTLDTIGLTIDNNFITTDSLNISISTATTTNNNKGF
jgi:hypothetical protein